MMGSDTQIDSDTGGWGGDLNPLKDAGERAVIFAALDSFR